MRIENISFKESKMKVVFLDRDGVINRYPGFGDYVKDFKEFHFLSGAKEAIKRLTENGFLIYIVSNQAGVSKGLFSKEKLKEITQRMLKKIEEFGGKIEGVFYCTHREVDNCTCRKPKIGLIQKAIEGKEIDLKDTFFIGDSLRDIETGKNAGCKTILVLSGETKQKDIRYLSIKPDFISRNLLEATEIVLKNL